MAKSIVASLHHAQARVLTRLRAIYLIHTLRQSKFHFEQAKAFVFKEFLMATSCIYLVSCKIPICFFSRKLIQSSRSHITLARNVCDNSN